MENLEISTAHGQLTVSGFGDGHKSDNHQPESIEKREIQEISDIGVTANDASAVKIACQPIETPETTETAADSLARMLSPPMETLVKSTDNLPLARLESNDVEEGL